VTNTAGATNLDRGLRRDLGTATDRPRARSWRIIVLATSGSRASIEATVFAAELAAALTASLRIVHVISPTEYRVGAFAPMRAVPRRLTDPFENAVLCQARELAWRHGTAATLQLVAGDPPQAIVAAATDAHADLLVIGARRSTRPRAAPTRRWIEAHAPCQVLTTSARSQSAGF
jgi:nucleotide-binding universal stress UspA family protein